MCLPFRAGGNLHCDLINLSTLLIEELTGRLRVVEDRLEDSCESPATCFSQKGEIAAGRWWMPWSRPQTMGALAAEQDVV